MSPDTIVASWTLAEEQFADDGYRGRTTADHFSITARDPGLFLTAVHGVKHQRGSTIKEEDQGTGGLVVALGDARGWSTAVVLREIERHDANHNERHPLKRALEARPVPLAGGIVIDVHGMAGRHRLDISIGLGDLRSRSQEVGEQLASAFEDHSLSVDLGAEQTGFRGRSRGSMTAWAQARGWSAVQVEIAPHLRNRSAAEPERQALVEAFGAGLAAASALRSSEGTLS